MNYFDSLAELTAQFSQIYSHYAKEYGLTLNELRFLYHLGVHGQTTPTEIGTKWALPKQTVTSLCKQLDRKGYLAFTPDEKDKRGKIIRLSAEGTEITHLFSSKIINIEMQTASDFGSEKFQLLNQYFAELQQLFIRNLGK
ncbi:MarR family transcriptional regulator [Actinobacillus succinogenes]|uniref:Transcriptional regulator, MarR family n=1 Tax=Actinobacillus succinogenes (strain ATCC 55618 / DSM 22257 / CCUG 43843 / 130Z) TaxID=339671 RepID=A6VMB6_ACTSZ|nr:MarR family transcriptional regulator [Actinobacillus succinogenes]ABR74113.1 transcriptional regulator, MarR family [Actinobacillus succinogenes 130Z]PHI39454.1 MarR family transcriptional regulator [Actinobacillus succinogenes]